MWNRTSLLIYVLLFLLAASCSKNTPSLKDAYKDIFYIGVALNRDQACGNDSIAAEIVKKHFNSITPENDMKWENIHPELNRYDFKNSDCFIEFGEKNNMFIIGHVLIWHQQTPNWVFVDSTGNTVSRDTLLERMRNHIHTVVGRYKGKVKGWDVINEAIDDNGKIRQNKWYEIIGEEYVQKAFEYAREADPGAELYYNDYSLPNPLKRDAVIKLIKNVQSKGVKVDAIGMQGHYYLDYPDLDTLEQAIVAFSNLGIKVMFTELEVSILPKAFNYQGADISVNYELKKELDPYSNSLPDSIAVKFTNRYVDFFKIFLKHKDKISRVTVWGVNDGQSWRNNWPINGRTDYPLLFDRQYQPKPVLEALIRCVEDTK